jgi:transposase
MFHWTDSRIEGHICLCYIAFALQNYVLQKVNTIKQVFTEATLRQTLDKMQVSLIKHNTEQVYLRSAPTANETQLQQQMSLKALPPVIGQNKISF